MRGQPRGVGAGRVRSLLRDSLRLVVIQRRLEPTVEVAALDFDVLLGEDRGTRRDPPDQRNVADRGPLETGVRVTGVDDLLANLRINFVQKSGEE